MEPKIFAYYFPQYYSIPENDIVFGKNFTDWNLLKDLNIEDKLLLKLPLETNDGLGYYDPTEYNIRIKQNILAKKYGIDGFIFYHYWLENKAVMNTVLDNLLIDNEPNIPFCLCFANESWKHCYGKQPFKSFHTDGSTFKQLYDKPYEHALYLKSIFQHKNYFKIDNRPVLFVYIQTLEVYEYLNLISINLETYGIEKLYLIANTSHHCLMSYNIPNSYNILPSAYSPFGAHTHIQVPDVLSKLPCSYGGLIGWNTKPRRLSHIINYTPDDITTNICRDLFKIKYDETSLKIYTLFAWNEWAEGAVIEPNTINGEKIGYSISKAKNIFNLLNEHTTFINIEFEYGYDNLFLNITKDVHRKCIQYSSNKILIIIPKGDNIRDNLFSDPIPNIHKVIKIKNCGIIHLYDEYTNINIEIDF